MTITTRFTELVGCTAPIQLAGMGGVSTAELAAAVCAAGGLGMLGATDRDLVAEIESVGRRAPGRPCGVNFLMPYFDRRVLDLVAPRVRVVEFFWARPDPELVGVAHDAGALASWQVGSPDEAAAAADAGCDLVVAQGLEAGGHVRGTTGVLALLDAVLQRVDVPVLAAGGVGTGAALAAVLVAGASGARVGTRFVATVEADAHPAYQQALVEAGGSDTVYTDAFSVWWPDQQERAHRVLRSALAAAESSSAETVAQLDAARLAIPRFAVMPPTRETTGDIGRMALYAGESVGGVRRVIRAEEVVRELIDGAEEALKVAPGPPNR